MHEGLRTEHVLQELIYSKVKIRNQKNYSNSKEQLYSNSNFSKLSLVLKGIVDFN